MLRPMLPSSDYSTTVCKCRGNQNVTPVVDGNIDNLNHRLACNLIARFQYDFSYSAPSSSAR